MIYPFAYYLFAGAGALLIALFIIGFDFLLQGKNFFVFIKNPLLIIPTGVFILLAITASYFRGGINSFLKNNFLGKIIIKLFFIYFIILVVRYLFCLVAIWVDYWSLENNLFNLLFQPHWSDIIMLGFFLVFNWLNIIPKKF